MNTNLYLAVSFFTCCSELPSLNTIITYCISCLIILLKKWTVVHQQGCEWRQCIRSADQTMGWNHPHLVTAYPEDT